MSEGVSRRDFIKVAGTTAGLAVATTYSPFSYARNEKVRVACIGTGGQGGFHIRYGLNNNPDIEIAAICDIYTPHREAAWRAAGGDKPGADIKKYIDYRELLDEVECDAVVIATPLFAHYHIAMDCLDAGKYVFCEKTMAYDVEECRNMVKKAHETGKWIQIGHQRRYNPEYNKSVWLARGDATHESATGRVHHVNAKWHRNNDWRRPVDRNYKLTPAEQKLIPDLEKHINWRLYKERSRGGLITELATHQLDVVNWFLGTMPSRVAASGGIDYWIDGREVNDNIVMIYDYEVGRRDAGFAQIPPRNEFQKRSQINRGYTVRYTYSSICANAQQGYGEHILGDKGSIYLTEQQGCTFYPEPAAKGGFNKAQSASAEATGEAIVSGTTREASAEEYKHGIPIRVLDDRGEPYDAPTQVDRIQFSAFANDIRTGGTPKANQMVGLYSAVSGFAALEAMETGSTVEIDPALYTFDFETPDPFRFDFFEEPAPPEQETSSSKEDGEQKA